MHVYKTEAPASLPRMTATRSIRRWRGRRSRRSARQSRLSSQCVLHAQGHADVQVVAKTSRSSSSSATRKQPTAPRETDRAPSNPTLAPPTEPLPTLAELASAPSIAPEPTNEAAAAQTGNALKRARAPSTPKKARAAPTAAHDSPTRSPAPKRLAKQVDIGHAGGWDGRVGSIRLVSRRISLPEGGEVMISGDGDGEAPVASESVAVMYLASDAVLASHARLHRANGHLTITPVGNAEIWAKGGRDDDGSFADRQLKLGERRRSASRSAGGSRTTASVSGSRPRRRSRRTVARWRVAPAAVSCAC